MQKFFRQMLVCALVCLSFFTLVQYPTSVSAQTENVRECLTLIGMEKNGEDNPFKMGESLHIRATDKCFDLVKDQLAKTDAQRGFKLFLDDVRMVDLPVNVLQTIGQNESILTFHLIRKSQEDENRKAWDTLLEKNRGFSKMALRVALAAGDQPAWSVSSFWFRIAKEGEVWETLGVGVLIFGLAYYSLVKKSSALKDARSDHYSLGKSQMAFWGLLIVLAFIGIWFLTGTMERIPPQVLILLGISGATGLSSIVIGEHKKSGEESAVKTKISSPDNEQQGPQNDLSSSVPAPANTDQELRSSPSAGFWRDICSDGVGMSFHRLQVVVWTVVLGVIFVDYVSRVMSMPEFSETLLTLLAISNGTYLGFKIPEKA